MVTHGISQKLSSKRWMKLSANLAPIFFVVIYPNEGAIYGNGLVCFIQSRTVARMQQLLAGNDIAYIDFLPVLLDHIKKLPEERLYYRVDGHPMRAWHRLVASILRKDLLSNIVLN